MQIRRRSFLTASVAAGAAGWFAGWGWFSRRQPSRVLLLTGQNNHDWRRTTPMMQQILEATGRFEVTVSTSPPGGSQPDAWRDWRPDFGAADVVLSDYNGEVWPDPVRDQFVEYVRGGGSVLIQHAANNAFPGWTEYEDMVGLLWRGAGEGSRLYWDGEQWVRQAPGEGIGAGHGGLHDWTITTRQADHPIFRDLPPAWRHAQDELYHGQRGPAEELQMLATAWSSPESGGSGVHEPMVWWRRYGEGKALTLLPGHLWGGQQDTRSFRCAGFQTLLQRSVEWLATGEVTLAVPDDFPTEEQTSCRGE